MNEDRVQARGRAINLHFARFLASRLVIPAGLQKCETSAGEREGVEGGLAGPELIAR